MPPLRIDPSHHANTNELAFCRCERRYQEGSKRIPARHLEMFLQASGNFATNSG